MATKPAILFVCLGNICRSPLAEAAFRKAAEEAGLDFAADSAGTAAYHIGSPPDPRSIATAAQHGIDISHYQGRQLDQDDFARFSHIYAMDHSNLRNIRAVAPSGSAAEIALLMDTVPGREGEEIADPYYGGEENFTYTWEDVWMAVQAVVARLTNR
ncbi:low molecular weight protein-tyrosine-phosphatase [Pontixanthobacter aestiaquae]|uniref:protein-tyrosine-phosphatase n=1 Tax=Pontixanthobacter aestiaquae TaxID=1509367 RepID=A0A844Z7W0_9SPHN|nr:low molecular weight protein-tyrosine-phosphatase [Pontixanthobacter aestiaquae]MDN3645591.1 low molecular weight protein-tyrosine-phosphatase [Pontixanthobacter aestiaquae]MXO83412.1 low molecular weight phosphotyrosine protein phosphatase [Pontixanthobacter aestiaquae]